MRFTTNNFTTDWERLEVGDETNTKSNITVIANGIEGAKRVFKKLDELMSWTKMKFEAKNPEIAQSYWEK